MKHILFSIFFRIKCVDIYQYIKVIFYNMPKISQTAFCTTTVAIFRSIYVIVFLCTQSSSRYFFGILLKFTGQTGIIRIRKMRSACLYSIACYSLYFEQNIDEYIINSFILPLQNEAHIYSSVHCTICCIPPHQPISKKLFLFSNCFVHSSVQAFLEVDFQSMSMKAFFPSL